MNREDNYYNEDIIYVERYPFSPFGGFGRGGFGSPFYGPGFGKYGFGSPFYGPGFGRGGFGRYGFGNPFYGPGYGFGRFGYSPYYPFR